MAFIVIELTMFVARINFIKKEAGLSLKEYFGRVALKSLPPVIASCISCWIVIIYFDFYYRFLLTIMISAIIFIVTVYFVALCQDEKMLVNGMIRKVIAKLK